MKQKRQKQKDEIGISELSQNNICNYSKKYIEHSLIIL